MPHRNRYVLVCTNRRDSSHPKGSCAHQGSEDLLKALKRSLLERGLAQHEVRACSTSCLDLCEYAASVVVEPEHVVYGRVTLADVDDIVDALAEQRVVDRLVVKAPAVGASTTSGPDAASNASASASLSETVP